MRRLLIILTLLGIMLLAGCWAPPVSFPAMPHMPNWMWGPFGFIGWLVGLAIYLLPTIIAVARRKSNLLLIVLLNVLLGWTLVGWVIALVIALL